MKNLGKCSFGRIMGRRCKRERSITKKKQRAILTKTLLFFSAHPQLRCRPERMSEDTGSNSAIISTLLRWATQNLEKQDCLLCCCSI